MHRFGSRAAVRGPKAPRRSGAPPSAQSCAAGAHVCAQKEPHLYFEFDQGSNSNNLELCCKGAVTWQRWANGGWYLTLVGHTRVSVPGGPYQGYLVLVARKLPFIASGPHEGNRWPRHFSPARASLASGGLLADGRALGGGERRGERSFACSVGWSCPRFAPATVVADEGGSARKRMRGDGSPLFWAGGSSGCGRCRSRV